MASPNPITSSFMKIGVFRPLVVADFTQRSANLTPFSSCHMVVPSLANRHPVGRLACGEQDVLDPILPGTLGNANAAAKNGASNARATTNIIVSKSDDSWDHANRRLSRPLIFRPSRMLRPSSVMFAAPAASSNACTTYGSRLRGEKTALRG